MNGSVTVVPGAGGGGGGPPPSEGGGSSPPPTSSAPPTSSPPPSTSGGETTTITASGLAFDLSTITLPADKEWQLTFDNEDTGVEHDLSIYTDQSAGTTKFHGDPVTGVATADYKIPPLAAGTYYFQCDFHPDSMHGTVTVG
jgi:plastocyanin